MSHLGDRLSALVDGELGHDERDRLYAHLAGCAECRAEAAAFRALKRRLGALGEAAMDRQLLSRLLALAEPGESVAARRHPSQKSPPPSPALPMYPGSAVPAGGQELFPLGERGHRTSRAPRQAARRRAPYLVAGAFSALVLGVGGVSFLAGGDQSSPGPRITPPVGIFTVEHSVMTGEVPFAVPAISLVPAGTGPGRRGGP